MGKKWWTYEEISYVMSKETIGILMPGDMGHGCGKVFLKNN